LLFKFKTSLYNVTHDSVYCNIHLYYKLSILRHNL